MPRFNNPETAIEMEALASGLRVQIQRAKPEVRRELRGQLRLVESTLPKPLSTPGSSRGLEAAELR